MFSPLLMFMLQLTLPTLETLEQTPHGMRNVSRRDSPTLPPPNRHPPGLLGSALLLEKEQLSPSRGTRQEPVREVLLPVRANASPPQASGVFVRTSCELNKILVQVHRSILGRESDSQLTLGTCRASRSTREYVYFEYDIGLCGTKRTMINNQVVYSNTLQYDPLRLQGPIRRAVPFTRSIACYYNRYQYSDYTPKLPLREIFTPTTNKAKFILTPRNAHWEKLSPSNKYMLGRSMYFQAEAPSITQDKRLYVHFCYATLEKSHTSTPQYPIVLNFGCMVESKDSQSRFVPFKRNTVRFSLSSFYFMGITNQELYMHCSVSVGSPVPTTTAKSCNYDIKTKRWVELYGSDLVCTCCDSSCSSAASPVTQMISSQPWTIDPKVKPSTASIRKKVSTTPSTTTTTTTTSQPDAMAVTLVGKLEDTVQALEWLFGGEGVSWVMMEGEEEQVTGSAVVEEVEEEKKMEITEPRTIFDEIFGFVE
ncbi:zona pellucida sperm-binding protein 3d.2 [Clinocottus analis]|uniref:zona pellucida sperm-binding protein 3d.2 n=1 Tax=Clinocottus analis TaxID=304258 RepID=UPI0035C0C4A9